MLDLSCLKKDAISQIYARALVYYRNPNRFLNDLDIVDYYSRFKINRSNCDRIFRKLYLFR